MIDLVTAGSQRPTVECLVDFVIGSLEYIFYVGVIALLLGVGIALIQFLAVRIFRASQERVWTLKIWPATACLSGNHLPHAPRSCDAIRSDRSGGT